MDLLKKVEWFEKLAVELIQGCETREIQIKSKRQERIKTITQIINAK